jgi:arylsulfatase A-like enzyme
MAGKEVYSQNLFMDSVLNFLEENKDRPFFLYFPSQLPHGPVSVPEVHPDYLSDTRLTQIEKEYASMVRMLDDHVGLIMGKLKDLNIDENTLVIFTSDNGHEIYYAQEGRVHKPYTNMSTGEVFDNSDRLYYSHLAGDVFDGNGGRAGLKRSNLQGGIAVPLIMRWPDQISPGRISKRLVANYDILPTLAEIVGFDRSFHSDGLSFYPELKDETSESKHDYVVYSSFLGPTLITSEAWKIRTVLKDSRFELYKLDVDEREEHDLAHDYPRKVKDLKETLLKACDGDLMHGLYSSGYSQIDIE